MAVLFTRPETVLDDYVRLGSWPVCGRHWIRGRTILKDNISWHFPSPAPIPPLGSWKAASSPCEAGFERLSCVQNRTVVTNAFKGTDLSGYWPICKAHDVPVLFNFKPEDMKWVEYSPDAMLVLDRIFEGTFACPITSLAATSSTCPR